ncbi:MAG: transglycosylase domain-containing protein [Chloroflexota bacterium]|nr:transglycosylase domain-containing protein [Chloroflexota bacterium]
MPDDPAREKPPADEPAEPAPISPEEMMGALLDPAPTANEPMPPEDYDSHLSAGAVKRYARPEDLPIDDEQPPAPDARDRDNGAESEVARRFIEMQNQAATLADLLNKEEINFEDYQRLLYEAMVQDEQGVWWMIDAENEDWYRHDPDRNQWEVGYPAALREYEGGQSASFNGDETLTEYDLPSTLGAPKAGEPIYDERGVKIGTTPPTKDELYTVPGTAALADEIPGQQPTLPGDAQLTGTIPAAAQADPSSVIPRAIDADFALGASPVVQELLETRRSRRTRLLMTVLAALLMLGLAGGIIAAGVVMMWYRDTVEPFADGIAALANYSGAYQTARIFDSQGNLLAALNSEETGARTAVPLEQISPFMIHAIVSQENERFFDDPGFDPVAIVRAFMQNVSGGGVESGASTITQQIARNLVLKDRDVTVQRKLNEILVALEIANRYDKNFILALYLNEIFFANRNYGVEAASNFYFGHSADQLNYAEAALLASIVPSPVQHDPVENRATAIAAMRSTMRKMIDIGCLQFQHGDWLERGPFCIIDGAEDDLVKTNAAGEIAGGLAILQIAEIETTRFQQGEFQVRYPHFVDFARAAVVAELGEEALFQRGLSIHTTLNPALQETAAAALSDHARGLKSAATGVHTGAVMVTDPATGAIRAMVGSHDYYESESGQVNNALTFQQPGSAIKPFVYMAALQEAEGRYLTPASIIWDVPLVEDLGAGGIYQPQNVDRKFHGPVSVRSALQNSYNVPTVKIFRDYVGAGRFANTADALGLQFPDDSFISLASALGANEVSLYDMMRAYAVLANGGARVPLYAIERITESVDGEHVEIPRERPAGEQVISPALAYLMQNILSDDGARAPSFPAGSNLTLARAGIATPNTVAAKTGTTNGGRDLWTMGFTRSAVVGVWLGTSDNTPTYNTSGYRSAAPLWNTIMAAATNWYPPRPFENPGGVVAREVCRTTGTLGFPTCPEPTTDLFLHEQYPPAPETGFLQRVAVDSWTLLRANEFCASHVTERNFVAVSDAAALDWLNNSEAGRQFAQSLDLALPVKPPPQAGCAQGQQLPLINLSSPNDGAVLRGAVELRGQVSAPDFDKFELLYASAAAPETFYPISASLVQMPQYGSPLGVWDTVAAQVPNGETILRLAADSRSGGFIHFDLNVTVDNTAVEAGEPTFGPTVEEIIIPTPTSG